MMKLSRKISIKSKQMNLMFKKDGFNVSRIPCFNIWRELVSGA